MSKLNNFGACTGPHCRINAELCVWHMCGVCCRRLHSNNPTHTLAPVLGPDNHWSYSRRDVQIDARLPAIYRAKETEEKSPPTPTPVSPKLREVEYEYPGIYGMATFLENVDKATKPSKVVNQSLPPTLF